MAQDDDSFGLPDLNFKPLEPKPATPPPPAPKPAAKPAPPAQKKPEPPKPTGRIQTAGTPNRVVKKPGEQGEEGGSKTSIIVGILVPIFILVGGYFGYVYLYQKPKEKAAIEALRLKAEEAKKLKERTTADSIARIKADEEARLRELANAKPAIGTMEMLSAATGRFYVVVASSIDDDLVMDEAQRMSVKGVSTKIIPPFGKWKSFRLTISDHDTFALAQSKADESKTDYPKGVWVIRY